MESPGAARLDANYYYGIQMSSLEAVPLAVFTPKLVEVAWLLRRYIGIGIDCTRPRMEGGGLRQLAY